MENRSFQVWTIKNPLKSGFFIVWFAIAMVMARTNDL